MRYFNTYLTMQDILLLDEKTKLRATSLYYPTLYTRRDNACRAEFNYQNDTTIKLLKFYFLIKSAGKLAICSILLSAR